MTVPAVTVDGGLASVTFDRFDLHAYDLFIRSKKLPESRVEYDWERDAYTLTTAARFAPLLGADLPATAVDAAGDELAPHLFDYQRWAVGMALESRRFALWCDTGLGKMAMGLEFGRQAHLRTGGRVLAIMPLSIIPQYLAEAERFYGADLPIRRLDSTAAIAAWAEHGDADGDPAGACFGVTNYEKFTKGAMPELRHLAGLIADESSILKTGGGTIKWNLIKSARGIPYKLSCTATPAPNDAMEYASQAAFLETIRHEGEILWTYFSRDKYGVWAVKAHAREAFFRFMASWSLYLRDPAAFGFADILATLPAPVMTEERIPMTGEQRTLRERILAEAGAGLLGDDRLGVVARTKLAQIARGFLYRGKGKEQTVDHLDSLKPGHVADWVRDQVFAGRPTLVWTAFDEEGEIIRRALGQKIPFQHIGILTGAQKPEQRQELLYRFYDGQLDVLISKPSLIGYGLNLQHVQAMVFSGVDDSMERRYQAIRRAYRFGQTHPVHVHTPYVPELEGVMFDNVAQKEARFLEEVATQERHYRTALMGVTPCAS